MVDHKEENYSPRNWNSRWFAAVWVLSLMLFSACAGGIPSIPNSSDRVLAKADASFHARKYFQAQELYRAFLRRYPGHDRSDYVQFMLAESYYGDEEWGLAAVEYRILVNNYGYSDYVDDSYLKEGLCLYKQGRKSHLDQASTYDALEKLNRFIKVFADSDLLPEAQEHIAHIKVKLAEKEYRNGLFYFKRKRYKSALIYLDKVIDHYDGNEYWVRSVYLKGKVVLHQGDRDEAMRLFSMVIAYPEEIDVKSDAVAELQQLRRSPGP